MSKRSIKETPENLTGGRFGQRISLDGKRRVRCDRRSNREYTATTNA
jgi:hypothetical protein